MNSKLTLNNLFEFIQDIYFPLYKKLRNRFAELYSEKVMAGEGTGQPLRPLPETWKSSSSSFHNFFRRRRWDDDEEENEEERKRREEEEERQKKEREELTERQMLWSAVFYPQQKKTLKMICVDKVVESMVAQSVRRAHRRRLQGRDAMEEDSNENYWAARVRDLPGDVKELLHDELVARHMLLPDLEILFDKNVREVRVTPVSAIILSLNVNPFILDGTAEICKIF